MDKVLGCFNVGDSVSLIYKNASNSTGTLNGRIEAITQLGLCIASDSLRNSCITFVPHDNIYEMRKANSSNNMLGQRQ